MRYKILWLILFIPLSVFTLNGCKSYNEFALLEEHEATAKLAQDVIKSTVKKSPKFNSENQKNQLYRNSQDKGERLVMNAVVEDGQLISVDTLRSLFITAPSKHIPERGGMLDIPFNILIPSELIDEKWQIRVSPKLMWGGDSLNLDMLVITGKEYEDHRLRGLEKYRKFLDSIVENEEDYLVAFGYLKLIERFCKRNVDRALYNISKKEAEEYYINQWLLRSNDAKKREIGEMYKKWCESFEQPQKVRLDTILFSSDGDLIYKYLQRINYCKGMSKIKVSFSGVLNSISGNQYRLPKSDTLSFFVTSVAQLCSMDSLYVDKVIERKVVVESSAYINFREGEWRVVDTLSNNKEEICKVKEMFESLRVGNEFDIDSIVIVANCSPEGSYDFNKALANKRSVSVKEYFKSHFPSNIKLINYYVPEDWETLQREILSDQTLKDRVYLIDCFNTLDFDKREILLSHSPEYLYLKENLYPKLRRIDIKFALQRKGMIKDTIHTSEPDLNYLKAVEALKDRDYEVACSLIKGYKCKNYAIALIGMERNAEALTILNDLSDSPSVSYLKALVYSRLGTFDMAIMELDKAVKEDDNLIFRINLDPEINALVQMYNRDYKII